MLILRPYNSVEFRTFAQLRRLARYFTIPNKKAISTTAPETHHHNIQLVYEHKVAEGRLVNDSFQLKVIERFDTLFEEIKSYQPSTLASSAIDLNVFKKLFGRAVKDDESAGGGPKGVYLYGTVGCGKTMLMDMFYECCLINRKRRVHYHAFMNDIHRRIHQLKTVDSLRSAEIRDPISLVAADIVDQAWLLCLDEFQVTDVADAMILKHLFTELFKRGTVVVATSNRAPDDLYKNGLQRSNFLPFIAILKRRCHCICLDSHIDYRQKSAHSATAQFYFVKKQLDKQDDDADAQLNRIFKIMSARETDTVRPRILNVFGRHLELKKTCGGLLDVTFDELCVKPLGASDYIALSQAFHTVLIRDVPVFQQNLLGPARRFITLVDTFYDFHVRLVISAEAPLDKLFQLANDDSDDVTTSSPSDQNRVLMDDLNISATDEGAKANVFTGAEELFAFDRTVSRLMEMQSKEYWRHREPSSSSSTTN